MEIGKVSRPGPKSTTAASGKVANPAKPITHAVPADRRW
jgi:hypothetical protein